MATIVIPDFNTQKVVSGLNTYTYTIKNTGLHACLIDVNNDQASAVTATISQSGSVSLTLATTTDNPITQPNTTGQSAIRLSTLANCVAGDVITFTLTSSSAIDQQLNTIKSKIIVTQRNTAL